MKTTIIDEIQPREKLLFPVLAKTKTGKVVLFINECSGTLLVSTEDDDDPIGDYSNEYKSCRDKEFWTIIESITIQFTR